MKKIYISLALFLFSFSVYSGTKVVITAGKGEKKFFTAEFKDQIALPEEDPKAAQKLYDALADFQKDDVRLFMIDDEGGPRGVSCKIEIFRHYRGTYYTCSVWAASSNNDTVVIDRSLETTLGAEESEFLYGALKLPVTVTTDPREEGHKVFTKEVITEDNRFRLSCRHHSTFKVNGRNYVCQMVINGNDQEEEKNENH